MRSYERLEYAWDYDIKIDLRERCCYDANGFNLLWMGPATVFY